MRPRGPQGPHAQAAHALDIVSRALLYCRLVFEHRTAVHHLLLSLGALRRGGLRVEQDLLRDVACHTSSARAAVRSAVLARGSASVAGERQTVGNCPHLWRRRASVRTRSHATCHPCAEFARRAKASRKTHATPIGTCVRAGAPGSRSAGPSRCQARTCMLCCSVVARLADSPQQLCSRPLARSRKSTFYKGTVRSFPEGRELCVRDP